MITTSNRPADDKPDAVRGQILNTLAQLVEVAKACELPAPPDILDSCRHKLQENQYTVLVAGEAKRGKSTFVNALLGHALLPTDVDVATCQVFCIHSSEKEAYRLRFEDGSAQEITAADLPRFGSQVLANAGGAPRLDRIVRWIEVEYPAHFLPGEIRLLDTPGLGSLYAAHAQITQRFVPLADAVIFVLGSDSPISQEEIQFLDAILGVTQNILIIQTMIDRYKRDHWQAIQDRNQQILADKFNLRFPEPRVWPISSTNLLKAAQTGDPDYEEVSRFKPLAAVLSPFLFRAAGWGRAAEALLVAHEYHAEAGTILRGRLDTLSNSESSGDDIRRQMAERVRHFEIEWGDHSHQRQEMLEEINQAAEEAKQDIWLALREGCKVEVQQREAIEAVQSAEEARRLAASLPQSVAGMATDQWKQVIGRFQARSVALLEPLIREARNLRAFSEIRPSDDLAIVSGKGFDLGNDPFSQLMVAADQFVAGTVVAGTASLVLSYVIVTSWFPPLAIAGVLAAGVWAAIRGWQLVGRAQLQELRDSLHAYLDHVLGQVRQHFFSANAATGHLGFVDHSLGSQVRSLTGQVDKLIRQRLEEGQAELARLTAESELDNLNRKKRAEKAQLDVGVWEDVGDRIAVHRDSLRNLSKSASSHPGQS
jgi:GTP-binding protein EngB required for normal cell division/uncharacterized protein (DUF2267 family)